MSKCLVTTLKESVTDNDLLKFGEMKFRVSGSGVKTLSISTVTANAVTVTTETPGYITDSSGTSNLGTSAVPSTVQQTIYLSPGEYDVRISGKYSLDSFVTTVSNPIEINVYDFLGAERITVLALSVMNLMETLDIDFLKNFPDCSVFVFRTTSATTKVTGDIKVFKNLSNVNNINFPNLIEVYGDLDTFEGNTHISYIDFFNCGKITGDIAHLSSLANMIQLQLALSGVTGNISAFSGMTNMNYLTLQGTAVTGNLSSLANCTKLKTLIVDDTAITGDTSSLAGLTQLTVFGYTNTAITGTWPLT